MEAVAEKPKRTRGWSFERTMTSRGAVYWPQNLSYLISAHGMNYYKVLCLQWRASDRTPDSCGNKRHDADKYKHTLECESQLTEAIIVANQGGNQKITDLRDALLKMHTEMGCDCDWKPRAHPPLTHYINVKFPSRSYKIKVRVL